VKSLKLQLEAAGLARFEPWQVVALVATAALLISSWVQVSFGVIGLSASSFVAAIGVAVELLNVHTKRRSDSLVKVWPEVIDSLQSAATSGLGLIESIDEVGQLGPPQVRKQFAGLVQKLDHGESFDSCLDWLKSEFGQLQADRLIELIRVVHSSGGAGYVSSLKDQAQITRSEIATWGELESKQGWVGGTAKLAIIAPWIIVSILSSRVENVAIYNTSEGLSVLITGLAVSAVAYRLVSALGYLSKPTRVFTK
jgi:tight adherence protein B